MKKILVAAVMAVGMYLLFSGSVPAQSGDGNKGAPKMGAAGGRPGDAASLTDEQKAAVKSILSKYKPSALTVDDATAIHGAFRDAGLRGGPGLNAAVTSAGFDSDKLRDLDPPPAMQGREDRPGGQNEQDRRGGVPGKKQDK